MTDSPGQHVDEASFEELLSAVPRRHHPEPNATKDGFLDHVKMIRRKTRLD